MSRCKSTFVPYLLIAMLAVVVVGNSSAQAATDPQSPTSHCGSWQVVPSPNVGSYFSILNSVASVSASDVWAVGYSQSSSSSPTNTLIEHWNGSSWQVVKSPNVGAYLNYLNGVAAISTNDVWAVGYSQTAYPQPFKTLIEHWNGSIWSVVKSPNNWVGSSATLSAVSASSSTNVWAVGDFAPPNSGYTQTFAEHWNGTAWQVMKVPSPGNNYNLLSGVTAISANDVWAVGQHNVHAFTVTLTEHWNGTNWQVVKGPSPGSDAAFFGVAATSSNNVWAVGNAVPGDYATLAERWNGKSWQVVNSPNADIDNSLIGLAAVSANNVWAVGDSGDYIQNTSNALIEHWNGSSWQITKSPSPGADSSLSGVAAASASNVWAVGSYFTNSQVNKTLIEFYC